jgi:leucyl/phenylalanyl-tRNA--protein transferase
MAGRERVHEAGLAHGTGREVPAALTGVVFAGLSVVTWNQISHWRSSVTLFEHALRVTEQNSLAHLNLGVALNRAGKGGEAAEHYREALRINPNSSSGHFNLANYCFSTGQKDEALQHFKEAIRIRPDYANAHSNLGVLLASQRSFEEAAAQYEKALRLGVDAFMEKPLDFPTLLEAIAVACGFNAEGGTRNFNFSTRASHSPLHGVLALSKGLKRPRDGFFLRAESFFNVATEVERLDRESDAAPAIIDAYTALHEGGNAHSVETWREGRLIGGLYGVAIGRMFFGESMFADEPDASKIALVHLTGILRERGFPLVDCQQETAHLASFGARPIPRREFAHRVAALVHSNQPDRPWTGLPVPNPLE